MKSRGSVLGRRRRARRGEGRGDLHTTAKYKRGVGGDSTLNE